MEDYLARDLPAAKLSESLNQLGKEGWLLVNCWPSYSDVVTAVFRRERVYYSGDTGSYEPTRPLHSLTVEFVLERCLAGPAFRRRGKDAGRYERSLPLAKLGAEFGATQDVMAKQLQKIGFSKSTTTPDCFATSAGDYELWIHRASAEKPWILYAKRAVGGPQEAVASGSEDDEGFSVEKAIELCLRQTPKKQGYDHSMSLSQAAELQGVSMGAALTGFRKIGLPTDEHATLAKSYVAFGGRMVALREWAKKPGFWFLNVKSEAMRESS
jgi:hypothetical protein